MRTFVLFTHQNSTIYRSGLSVSFIENILLQTSGKAHSSKHDFLQTNSVKKKQTIPAGECLTCECKTA